MEKAYRTCMMCGKKYEYCHTDRRTGTFRWQDVGCCREHAMLYFTEVKIARKQDVTPEEIDDLNAYDNEVGIDKIATADGIFDKPENVETDTYEEDWYDDYDDDLYDEDGEDE